MTSTVSHVEVQTQADGSLLVSWEIEGEPSAVDVATGPSPDHVDHLHQTTAPAGCTSLRLPGPSPSRPYVSVGPSGGGPAVVAADRRIPFEGITNFRDLGGYRTASGTRLRWGQVFRADALHGLTAADLDLYRRLGLRSVYDLRGDTEREERPNPVQSRQHTIIGRPPGPEPSGPTATGDSAADGERFLGDLYIGLIDHAAAQIGQLYSWLVSDGGLPAVFHCHAGKDRTGIVAALLLEALGVERGAVLDDYELTSRYRLRAHQESTFERLLESGMSPEAAAGVLTTPRWAMEAALHHLDERYGGIGPYLTGPARMRPEVIDALRERLLEPRP